MRFAFRLLIAHTQFFRNRRLQKLARLSSFLVTRE